MLTHERVLVNRGARSGLPVIIAVHSTALGPAAGGCRMWRYPRWQDGLEDALRLSTSMTVKCAAAGLPHGGGKTVVALPSGTRLSEADRRAVLLDVGDAVDSLGGGYVTGPDVGTTPEDMVTIAERTRHVCCRPESAGGSGDSSPHTATGALAAIRATCRHVFGSADVNGRTMAVIGLGHVGGALAAQLTAAGARLVVTDIDPTKHALVPGATWMAPDDAVTAEVDVLIPAALGGLLTSELIPRLRCAAIAGPANNQLASDTVADELAARGICLAPDFVVSAGGAIHALLRELHGASPEEAAAAVARIDDTVAGVLLVSEREKITPHEAARRLAEDRVREAVTKPLTATR